MAGPLIKVLSDPKAQLLNETMLKRANDLLKKIQAEQLICLNIQNDASATGKMQYSDKTELANLKRHTGNHAQVVKGLFKTVS